MPRKDINDDDFIHHPNFPNDPNVTNIEFAAGKSFFGKREFPNCYLTDPITPDINHFMLHSEDYENHDCHYLDANCDYNNLNLEGKSFENVILCNPYGIGFRGRYETKSFLEIADTILSDTGTMTILGNSANPWTKYENIDKYYLHLLNSGELACSFDIQLEDIDEHHHYRLNHTFYHSDFSVEARPNQIIRIKKAA